MDSPAPDVIVVEPEAVKSAAANRTKILLYCSVIMVALNFVSPAVGFHVIPLSFVLKNKLHLSANALATFVFWAGIPAYFSFAFGVVRVRDRRQGLLHPVRPHLRARLRGLRLRSRQRADAPCPCASGHDLFFVFVGRMERTWHRDRAALRHVRQI